MSTPWHDRWNEGRIGFHRDGVNPHLVQHRGRFLDDGPHKVLVPLAGKTHDIPWLLARGHEVVAVELVDKAVQAFHKEQDRVAEASPWGPLTAWRSAGLTFLQGDVLALGPDHVAGIDRVWDRAAMVALPPEVRARYVARLRELLPTGSQVLLNHFVYDQSKMDGPPFSVPDDEVLRLYDGCDIELLEETNDEDVPPKFRQAGLDALGTRLRLITLD